MTCSGKMKKDSHRSLHYHSLFHLIDVPGIEFKEIAYGTDKDLEDAKDGPFYQAGKKMQ